MEELITTSSQAQFFWWLSWITLGSGIYACYWCGEYILGSLMICTFLTSINYWRKPRYGWHRNIDVAMVRTNLMGHLLIGALRGGPISYFFLTALAVSCYGIGVLVHQMGQEWWWYSAFWHAGLHILGNLGHIVLYNALI